MAWHIVKESGSCSSVCWCNYNDPVDCNITDCNIQLSTRRYRWEWKE